MRGVSMIVWNEEGDWIFVNLSGELDMGNAMSFKEEVVHNDHVKDFFAEKN